MSKFCCYILNPKSSGFVNDWIKLIPHVKSMGFNSIHLLPISQMGYSQSPYASINPFTIDPMYDKGGSSKKALSEFEKFVRALRKNKMHLCVDLVFNHVAVDHPLLNINKEWTVPDPAEADGMKRAGWFGNDTWHKWQDLALLNYEGNTGSALWDYMLKYALFWAGFAAQTDGFVRLDNLHSGYRPFMEFVLLQINAEHPNVRVVAELFSDEKTLEEMVESYKISYLLATQWEHKFMPELKQYLAYIHNTDFPADYFLPINSHDSGTVQEEYGDMASTAPRMVCSAMLGMGSWGVFQGSEYLIEEKLSFIGPSQTEGFYTPHKKYKSKSPQIDLTAKLNKVLGDYCFLNYKSNIDFLESENDTILCGLRFDPENKTKQILVLINFDYTQAQTITFENRYLLQKKCMVLGTHTDLLTNARLQNASSFGKDKTSIQLQAAQSLVFEV